MLVPNEPGSTSTTLTPKSATSIRKALVTASSACLDAQYQPISGSDIRPAMRERGDGRIVNISSVAGRMSLTLMGWYCASKHALEAVTNALRIEVADFGVKVVLVEPGSFGTNIWAGAQNNAPEPTTAAYAAAYERGTGLTSRAGLMPAPVWVARTIRMALASPLPPARYLVGVDADSGVLADKVVPTVLSDYVKGVASGLRRLPFPIPGRGRRGQGPGRAVGATRWRRP